ncbi:hypothetical protein [Shewanella sp. UCD-KL12]|uniref:hypothetical protein n=1 Tax=Shewanella sp. UCD-KL12 TaxID=1917163 RepID=UPI0009705847|nr:hypothetical protein [Shewanella sp. UCD-KL12]
MNISNQTDNQRPKQFDLISSQLFSALSTQKVITAGALALLLIAVQVCTQSVGDWFLFGLNVLEVTAPVHMGVSEISNVSTGLSNEVSAGLISGINDLGEMIWQLVKALIECLFG